MKKFVQYKYNNLNVSSARDSRISVTKFANVGVNAPFQICNKRISKNCQIDEGYKFVQYLYISP